MRSVWIVLAVSSVGVALPFSMARAQGAGEEDLEVPAASASAAAANANANADAKAKVDADATAKAKPTAKADVAARPDVHGVPDAPGLVVSGYVQAQYETSQISEDQRQQGGSPINQDRFLVRRGRLRVDRRWEGTWVHAGAAVELDGSTTRGPFFGVRRAEASLIFPGKPGPGESPLATITVGLTEVPFGHELVESSRSRWFMERSASSLAFFPGEPDVGVRVQGGVKFFRYAVAILNGEPLDDRAGSRGTGGREFNAAKDLVARVGIESDPLGAFRLAGGVSMLRGKGFHPGTDATKGSVVWQDANENSIVDQGEIRANPDQAALPSLSFDRWAVGADLRLSLRTVLGLSRVYGEVYVAQNLDRGLFFADPYAAGSTGNQRHLGWYVAGLQEVFRHVLVGLRVDVYNPNADALDTRAGRLVPSQQTITTLSPLVGVVLPDRARLLVQYDVVRDYLARDARGVPTDLKNDLLTLRLQVEL